MHALALDEVVAAPQLFDPRVGAGAAVELAGVGQQWVQLTVAEQSTKHRLTGNMVERPDRINKQDGGLRLNLGGGTE